MTTEELLTLTEAAAVLRVTERTVRRWCAAGLLPHHQIGRAYRFRRSDVLGHRGGASSMAVLEFSAAGATDGASLAPAPVVAIAFHKGGVGKTTTAVNLAAAFGERGRRVLVIDLDPQASTTLALSGQQDIAPCLADVLRRQIRPRDAVIATQTPNVWLLPSGLAVAEEERRLVSRNGRDRVLKPVVADVRDAFDLILFDTSPSLSDLSIAALVASTKLLVPVRIHLFSAAALRRFFATVEEVRTELDNPGLELIGLVVNQGALGRGGAPRATIYREVLEALRAEYGRAVLATAIPDSAAVEEAYHRGMSVLQYAPTSASAEAYRQLAEEVALYVA